MRIAWDAKRAFFNTTGLGNYSRDLIRMMGKYYPKQEYFLCTPSIKNIKNNSFYQNTVKDKMHLMHPSFLQNGAYWRSKGIKKDLEKNNIAIYHGLSNEMPFIHSANTKFVVSIHDLIFKHFPDHYPSLDRKIYEKKVAFACKNADLILAMSEHTKKDILNFYSIPEEKIQVQYQGVHPIFKTNTSKYDKEEFRKKYGLPKNFTLMLSAFQERKNHKLVLQALKSLKDKNVFLVLAGKKGKMYDKVLEWVKEWNLDKHVAILTDLNLQGINILYELANLCIQASHYEGFGIPVLEALTKKKACLLADNSSFPEIAKDAAWYFAPNNLEELREKWLILWNSQDDRNNLIQKINITAFEEIHLSKKLQSYYKNLFN